MAEVDDLLGLDTNSIQHNYEENDGAHHMKYKDYNDDVMNSNRRTDVDDYSNIPEDNMEYETSRGGDYASSEVYTIGAEREEGEQEQEDTTYFETAQQEPHHHVDQEQEEEEAAQLEPDHHADQELQQEEEEELDHHVDQEQEEEEPDHHVDQEQEEEEPDHHVDQEQEEEEPDHHVDQEQEEEEPAHHVDQEQEEQEPDHHVDQEQEEEEPDHHVDQEQEEEEPDHHVDQEEEEEEAADGSSMGEQWGETGYATVVRPQASAGPRQHPSQAKPAPLTTTVEKSWELDVHEVANSYGASIKTKTNGATPEPSTQQGSHSRVSPIASAGAPAPSLGEDVCRSCHQRVYPMEKLTADKHVYHKGCFKCSKCRRTLGVGNFAVNNDILYCKPHFMELFKIRGHYDERKTSAAATPVVSKNGSGECRPSAGGRDDVALQRHHRVEEQEKEGEQEQSEGNIRADVVRSEEPAGDDTELPPPDVTKNLLAKFRGMQVGGGGGTHTVPAPVHSPIASKKVTKQQRSPASTGASDEGDDGNDHGSTTAVNEQELPQAGTTRHMVTVWRSMEHSGPASGGLSPANGGAGGLAERGRKWEKSEQGDSGSSQRRGSADVRADDPVPDELPPPQTAKSMAAMFRALEQQGAAPTPETSSRLQKLARDHSGINPNVRLPGTGIGHGGDSGLDEPLEQNGRSVDDELRELRSGVMNRRDEGAENEPQPSRGDVVQAGNRRGSGEEQPEQGTTRGLVALFRSMQPGDRVNEAGASS